jgi:hypothetical protein
MLLIMLLFFICAIPSLLIRYVFLKQGISKIKGLFISPMISVLSFIIAVIFAMIFSMFFCSYCSYEQWSVFFSSQKTACFLIMNFIILTYKTKNNTPNEPQNT